MVLLMAIGTVTLLCSSMVAMAGPKDSDLILHVVYDDSDSEDGGHDVYAIKNIK